MAFHSFNYIFYCIPLALAGYFLINRFSHRISLWYLIAVSFLLYAAASWKSAGLLLAGLLVNYCLSVLIRRFSHKKLYLTLGLVFQILLLLYFKYFNFFLENLNLVPGFHFRLHQLLLPLGISFIAFQQISYLLSAYRDPDTVYSFSEYGAYILFFPKLVMGPLTEPAALIPQFRDPQRSRLNWDHLMMGLRMFNIGLFKKAVFADLMAIAVDTCFQDVASLTCLDTWLMMLCYTFQIYFDFSGYSDMAIGIAKMMNIDLPMNFNSPYKALSIQDFWKRWHMSLTRFFTRNVYIPLGGNRQGMGKTCRNVMIVFLVSGFWHGASWTFLLWGLLHGLFMVADRLLGEKEQKLPTFLRWSVTFLLVNLLWLLFRSESISQWLELITRLFSFSSAAWHPELFRTMFVNVLPNRIMNSGRMFVLLFALFLAGILLILLRGKNIHELSYKPTVGALFFHLFLILFRVIIISVTKSNFVYFGF